MIIYAELASILEQKTHFAFKSKSKQIVKIKYTKYSLPNQLTEYQMVQEVMSSYQVP